MRARTAFTKEEAWMLGWVLGVDWDRSAFDVDEFRAGLDAELERAGEEEDGPGEERHLDPIRTARRALVHMAGPAEG